MSHRPAWSTAWVTGASSGLGLSIAQRLARQGTKVAVSARSAEKLDALCATDPNLLAYPLDVRDAAASERVAGEIVAAIGIPDLVILNAGVGIFKNATGFDGNIFRTAVETNVLGIGNALSAIIPLMVARGSGHIALMGSLASFRGIPHAAHYAPTKAAIRSLAECLRFDLEEKGINVTIINPGYVETPLTERIESPMPGLMPLDPAIDRIIEGLEKRRYEIAFPWRMVRLVKLGMAAPNSAYFAISRWILGRA